MSQGKAPAERSDFINDVKIRQESGLSLNMNANENLLKHRR